MNDTLSTGRITPKEREALHALLDSGALAAVKLEKQKALLAKRKEVRARLQPLPALKIELAKKEAAWSELLGKVAQARHALNVVVGEASTAYTEMLSAQSQHDRLQYSVSWDLYGLADPRVHGVAGWLASMRSVANNAFQTESVIHRTLVGNRQALTDNKGAIDAAVTAIDKASADLEDLVLSSNAIDFGPDLERIKDGVLKAFAPLIDGRWQSRQGLPELNLFE